MERAPKKRTVRNKAHTMQVRIKTLIVQDIGTFRFFLNSFSIPALCTDYKFAVFWRAKPTWRYLPLPRALFQEGRTLCRTVQPSGLHSLQLLSGHGQLLMYRLQITSPRPLNSDNRHIWGAPRLWHRYSRVRFWLCGVFTVFGTVGTFIVWSCTWDN